MTVLTWPKHRSVPRMLATALALLGSAFLMAAGAVSFFDVHTLDKNTHAKLLVEAQRSGHVLQRRATAKLFEHAAESVAWWEMAAVRADDVGEQARLALLHLETLVREARVRADTAAATAKSSSLPPQPR